MWGKNYAVMLSSWCLCWCSVEEASLAVGEVVGYESVKSASRMNGAIVMFLDATAKVSEAVEKGVVMQDTFAAVLPLISPVPPFIKIERWVRELSQIGLIVSEIKMVSLGCKSAKVKHVVCHRRQVYIILKDPTCGVNLSFSFKIDGYSYVFFATSENVLAVERRVFDPLLSAGSCPGLHGLWWPPKGDHRRSLGPRLPVVGSRRSSLGCGILLEGLCPLRI